MELSQQSELDQGRLPTRAIGVLYNAGIETRAQAKEAILNGTLLKRRACGKVTFNDICEWVGMPKPYDCCPTCGKPINRKNYKIKCA